MKINMDHMRLQITGAVNHLGRELLPLLIALPEQEREEMLQAFYELAGLVGGLNCVYSDQDDDQFNDISEQVQVMDLGEALEKQQP